jgi:putative membrane protein
MDSVRGDMKMDRRNLIALLAVVSAAPAIAYSKEGLGEAEKEHAMQTLAIGTVALNTAKVAEDKAENAWVKRFAKYEVAEQTAIAEIFISMGIEPPKLTDKQSNIIEKIKAAKAGASFDEEFLAGQLDGHKELLKVQSTYIDKGKDEAAINLSKLASAQIKEHIDLIETIQKQLKS